MVISASMVGITRHLFIVQQDVQKIQRRDETVATVGDEKITKDELYDMLVKASGQEALMND